MSGPQFIHLETYARETSKNKNQKKNKTNIRGVVGEALREAGYTSHIKAVNAPVCVLGSLQDLADVETEIYEKAATEKDPLGRKLRSDANLLLAGVVSYPKPRVAQSPDDQQNYELWKTRTLDFLTAEFGDNLRCVLEHVDEEYPHLHFYVVDRFKVTHTMNLHPGHRAKADHPDQKDKIGREAAYRAAMVAWQDQFYLQVGSDAGLTRLGPKVQRLNRGEWKAQKQQAQAVASFKHSIDQTWEDLQGQLAVFEAEKATFDKRVKQAIKDAISKVREQYEQGLQMLASTLEGLKKTKDRISSQYPDKAAQIQQKGMDEIQASRLLAAYDDVKEEKRKQGGGSTFKPPAPKKPWEVRK